MASENASSSEKPKTLEKGPIYAASLSLEELRESIKRDQHLYEEIAQSIGIPLSGHLLGNSMYEITSYDKTRQLLHDFHNSLPSAIKPPEQIKNIIIKNEIQMLDQRISQHRQLWYAFFNRRRLSFDLKPPEPLEKTEKEILGKYNMTLRELVFELLIFGLQKEEDLNKIHSLKEYHFPETEALWTSVLMQVAQQYGQEALERDKIMQYIYPKSIARGYHAIVTIPDRILEKVKTQFTHEVIVPARLKAQQMLAASEPAMEAELIKKGMNETARKRLYSRAVVFLSEDPVGTKIASMVETVGSHPITKSGESVLKTMEDGLVSPLFAMMLACSIDGAPDKEKAIIQYFSFLVAGAIAQEGAKPAGAWLVKFMDKIGKQKLFQGGAEWQKISRWLLSDAPKTKAAVMLATIAAISLFFKFPGVTDKIQSFTDWADRQIPHGKWREDVGSAIEIISIAAAWELYFGWQLTKEFTGLNTVNPWKEQNDFLYSHLDTLVEKRGSDAIVAWNNRVSDLQKNENGTQKALLEEQKISSPASWSEQNVLPFQQALSQFDSQFDTLLQTLRNTPRSPSESATLLGPGDKIRYREYALSDDDIWNTRDHLSEDETDIGGDKINRLASRNDKALRWLRDAEGVEGKLESFFYHIDDVIAQEKNKCTRPVTRQRFSAQGEYYYDQTVQEIDPEAYKKIEPWVLQMQSLKKQWFAMQSGANDIAKRVTIARSLGAYKQSAWTESPMKSGSLAFKALFSQMQSSDRLRELTTPKTATQAIEILESAGSEIRTYGTDGLSPEKMKRAHEEFKKYDPDHGYGSTDFRQVIFHHCKSLIDNVYREGIPLEYIQKAFQPISDIARNQGESGYVSPEVVWKLESELGRLLLDEVVNREIDKRNGVVNQMGREVPLISLTGQASLKIDSKDVPKIQYSCPGYTFTRVYEIRTKYLGDGSERDIVIESDSVDSSMYYGQYGKSTAHLHTEPKITPLSRFKQLKKHILLQNSIEEFEKRKIRIFENTLKKDQQEIHKNDSLEKFSEYYDSEPQWIKITAGKNPVYARLHGGEEVSAPQKGWGWSTPSLRHSIEVAAFFGPGDIRETTLSRLDNLKSLDAPMSQIFRDLLTSGSFGDPVKTILRLVDGSVNATRHYPMELAAKLSPVYENRSDKKAFLSKMIDVLLKYPGVSGDTWSKILKEVL